ncbi:glycine cleavage system protein GcvH [Plasticicumulans sp.]|uniref:glycine cleavage system protein GcvH n=1 Tax=Plasticicumulans sp. TaxID=2307179 RepID=UPI000FABAD69|nr:glycine cleavage system protein GcvH [Plasticicumulans sp.]MBS0600077.1 glycine cleavage system protein GcvH [Pseudomonadota bacterium]RTL02937.1 MAG: glycine cleavage system protein GcvH [Xanthomonadales bacterium]TXI23665.1 MAG: glycine cleavage system protein GcvH [Ottowia sp.]HMV39692.1 glycine cleavage system protein GcvH [Plasticicumulans sp.]HMW29969.1 glycine cleavage system protein GcvH [Plasticicumulans sp.]
MNPSELLYTKEHEWLRAEDDGSYTLGVTEYAQKQLGDIVFCEQPVIGAKFEAEEPVGTLESVKAVAEVYVPVGCEITAINEALNDSPELVNEDPYGEGWLFRLKATAAPEGLLSADAYEQYLQSAE